MRKHHQYHVIAVGTILAVLLLSGCGEGGGPDLTPLGNGLAFIGLGIVLAAFIRVLGDQWSKPKKEENDEKPQ